MANLSVGKAIDEIAKLQLKKIRIEITVKVIDQEISKKKEVLLGKIKKSFLHGAMGALGRATVDEEDVPTVEDFEKLCNYAAKKKDWDLLQKRISKEAWNLRLAEGKKIPGVGVFHRVSLRVSPIKARRK